MAFREIFEKRVARDGKKPFVFFRDRVIDYVTLQGKVHRAANLLRELGVRKGDPVCLFLPNCLEFLYLWFGLAEIGGVMVPLDVNLRGEGLKYIINHCDARWIVVNERLLRAYSIAENDLPRIDHRVWHGEGDPPGDKFFSLKRLMEAAEEKAPPRLAIREEDPLGILYTSGATGPPKGVMISHFNYLNSGEIWAKEVIHYRPDDVFFTTLPLFHANAQMFTAMGSLLSGRPFVLQERFSASRFFDEIRQYGATIFNYIGGMLAMILKQPGRGEDADNPARVAFGGGVSQAIWRAFEKRFQVSIVAGYALTESGGVCLCNSPEEIKVGSIGKPLRFWDATIWDENNMEVPIGENGEIVVKGKAPHSMFLGYYKQPDKTKEAWGGGWFHTGDRGYRDVNGYFYLIDRMKEGIRRREENISAQDIERVANSHPKVLESAAIPVPSDLGEDDVMLFAVLRSTEQLAPEELIAFCEERMAYFMVPRYVQYVKELPKTATQKIQKYELKQKGIGDAWDRKKAGYKLSKF
jgi:crotonobetaine/carnitine-CoA ligase